jgi:hypothetical protein
VFGSGLGDKLAESLYTPNPEDNRPSTANKLSAILHSGGILF